MSEERERDLVLSPNEFSYVLDTTKGLVSSVVGPFKMSLSNSDKIVAFNETTKRFEESAVSKAISRFVSAPENWYVVLKNPTRDGTHPRIGSANSLPELKIGKQINIPGPCSFALYPGQMAKVIRGHQLRSNQYVLARVYDSDALGTDSTYEVGELLIIKGTDVSFYIPPTGIKVIPTESGAYVRDAVSLEKLEYCILLNEEGEKKYIHGPAVVFPEPDEIFVINQETGDAKFKAIELSPISGIHVKVTEEYCDEYTENAEDSNSKNRTKCTNHKVGEELFITGNDQLIYYPRPEHAIITYDNKVLHHAIAIPEGEGRYLLNRRTGDVTMIKGPKMYLPDPREEVVVHRKLSAKECELIYPNNKEVLRHNTGSEVLPVLSCDLFYTSPETYSYSGTGNIPTINASRITTTNAICLDNLDNGFIGQDTVSIDKNSGFNRGNKYSKPRTITLDNKYDGVVTVNVWTGYAANVVSKKGTRKVVVGPQTYLLEYDETLEGIELSTGTPKSTDNLIKTAYLRIDNNKVSDVVRVQTKDFVDIDLKLSYCVDFIPEKKDKWFSVDNYVKFLTDRMRSMLKNEAKKYSLEEFYINATDIVRKVVLKQTEKNSKGYTFEENGMIVTDVEVLENQITNTDVANIFEKHQFNIVSESLKLSSADKQMEVAEKLAKAEQRRLELEMTTKLDGLKANEMVHRAEEAAQKAAKEAVKSLSALDDAIATSQLARQKKIDDQKIALQKEYDKLEVDKQKAYTDAIKKVIDSISPDLVSALTTSAKADMLCDVACSLSPYALASGDESIADVVNKLLRGTSLEGLLDVVTKENK